jgi:Zn-dependent oligopeptidase
LSGNDARATVAIDIGLFLDPQRGFGHTLEPMALYRAFRGREPKIDALLAQRGRNL